MWARCAYIKGIRDSLKKLESIDDATLTQLLERGSICTVVITRRRPLYEELIDKFGSSLTLLNGLAVAKMHQKDYDEAQKRLQEALGKKSDDADALINLITCSAHMGKEEKEINRYQQLLYGAHPNHPYVVNMKAKEAEVDRLAAEYLEKEGLEEDAEGNVVKVGN